MKAAIVFTLIFSLSLSLSRVPFCIAGVIDLDDPAVVEEANFYQLVLPKPSPPPVLFSFHKCRLFSRCARIVSLSLTHTRIVIISLLLSMYLVSLYLASAALVPVVSALTSLSYLSLSLQVAH